MTSLIVPEQKEETFLDEKIEPDAAVTTRESSSAHNSSFRGVIFRQDLPPRAPHSGPTPIAKRSRIVCTSQKKIRYLAPASLLGSLNVPRKRLGPPEDAGDL